MKKSILIQLVATLMLVTFNNCTQQAQVTPDEAREIAKEAYIYGFPMAMNYKTMYMYVIDENSPEYKGPFNYLPCDARVLTPEDKAVVTPNSDTPYCMFWGDLQSEPLVLTIPEIEANRFYQVQLIDLYTHNFAYVGTITRGNNPGNYLLAGPGWQGDAPEGIDEVISCETDLFFAIVRTQLFGPDDLDRVKEIMDGYQFRSLSTFLETDPIVMAPVAKFPEWIEGDQLNTDVFKYVNFMLGFTEPYPDEMALMEGFAKINIGKGLDFNLENFTPEISGAIEAGVKEGIQEIESFIARTSKDPLASAKIFGTREFLMKSAKENYGLDNYYILRAMAAHLGLYGNSGTEAIYPVYLADSEGNPLNASGSNYEVTFEEGEFPPVKAFWSLTMYDGKTQLLVDNSIDRYLLNSPMMDGFILGDDGSLTFYIQKDPPAKDLEPNWLPAPDGPFYVVLRLYGPKEAALTGEWVNPPILKVNN